MRQIPLEHWLNSLPRSFEFYHLGKVHMAPPNEEEPPLENPIAVAYALGGAARGSLVMIFDGHLDRSTYYELGNIIASQMATELNSKSEQRVSVSPPVDLGQEGAAQYLPLAGSSEGGFRTYLHHLDSYAESMTQDTPLRRGRVVTLRALIIPSKEIAGNA